MAKIYNNLYDQILHPLNLWRAYKNAARGKRYTPALRTPIFRVTLRERIWRPKSLKTV